VAVNGRDVVDDDATASTDDDDDLRDRWWLARWLLVGRLALAAIMVPDEHAPVAGLQAHTKASFPTLSRPLNAAVPAPPEL